MKTYLGNYLGMVINSSDPEYRGRVQVFVPHVMPALYDGWNKEGADIQISCVGSNIPEGLTPEIHQRLIQILPWAESASPIIGGSAPGNLFSDMLGGAARGAATGGIAGAVTGAVAAGVNHFYNQGPTSAPVQVEGGDYGNILDKTGFIANLQYANNTKGTNMCARGTTAQDKVLGLIDPVPPGGVGNKTLDGVKYQTSAGFNGAKDLAIGETNSTGYNPYTTGLGAKNFDPPFRITPQVTVNETTGKRNLVGAQVGDSVFAGGGNGWGHAQKYVGNDKNGDQIWVSDFVQPRGFLPNYTNFTVYRLKPEALAKYTAAIGGKVTGQEPPSTTALEQTGGSGVGAPPNPQAKPEGPQEGDVAPTPQTMTAGGPGTGTPAGTISGGGTIDTSSEPLKVAKNPVNQQQLYNTIYNQLKTKMGNNPVPQDITKFGVQPNLEGLTTLMMKVANKESGFDTSVFGDHIEDGWSKKTISEGRSSTGKVITGGSHGLFQMSPMDAKTYNFLGFKGNGDIIEGTNIRAFSLAQIRDPNFSTELATSIWANSIIKSGQVGNRTLTGYGWLKDRELEKLARYTGQGIGPGGEGLPGQFPQAAPLAANGSLPPSVINNTDGNGRTPVHNLNDMASGLFAFPNPGAMVWVFFREGNPLFPVYFAASYSSAEWQSAYRGSSPGNQIDFSNPGKVATEASHFKPSSALAISTRKRTNLDDPLDNESVASISHEHGSGITFKNGCDFFRSAANKRDEVDNDRHEVTRGYKDTWIEGDESKNTRGDSFIKVGNITQEAIDAMNELSEMSYKMNQMLKEKSTA